MGCVSWWLVVKTVYRYMESISSAYLVLTSLRLSLSVGVSSSSSAVQLRLEQAELLDLLDLGELLGSPAGSRTRSAPALPCVRVRLAKVGERQLQVLCDYFSTFSWSIMIRQW